MKAFVGVTRSDAVRTRGEPVCVEDAESGRAVLQAMQTTVD